MTQKEGVSVYKARKLLNLKYSTAKHIVSIYKSTGKADRTNAITHGKRLPDIYPEKEKEKPIDKTNKEEAKTPLDIEFE